MNTSQFSNTATMSFGCVDFSPEEQHRSTHTQWSKVILHAGLSPSQIRAIQRLIAIRQLPRNWDSYESPPPSESAISAAIRILVEIDLNELPSPRVLPISGGGVQLEWDVGTRELELEVLSGGMIRYLKVERGEPLGENEIAPSNSVLLRSLFSWLVSDTVVERAA